MILFVGTGKNIERGGHREQVDRIRVTVVAAYYRCREVTVHLTSSFLCLFHHSRILWMQQTTSRSAQSSMHRHVVCDVFRAICDVKDAKAPVVAVRNSALLVLAQWRSATLSFVIHHRLLSARVKSGLRGGHDSGEGGRCNTNTTTNPLAWERFIQEYTHSHLLCVQIASQIADEPASSRESWFDLCSLFTHPNTRYQTPLNTVPAHSHTGLSSRVKSYKVVKCRHDEIKK
jgi:hypothetical protein